MVPLFPIAFPKSLRATAKACLPAAIAASLFAGCISDGPNQTGTQFLEKHDILLTTPVYHVKLKAFPADSFWTTDQYPDPEHISDTIILAGNYRNHEMVVSHEMLHSLIGQSGHPPLYFEERCHLTWETWAAN